MPLQYSNLKGMREGEEVYKVIVKSFTCRKRVHLLPIYPNRKTNLCDLIPIGGGRSII